MNWAHVHLITNHVPVLGAPLIAIMLVYASIKRESELLRFSYFLAILIGLATLAVYFTGEPAEGIVEHLPGVQKSLIESHEDVALYGLLLTEAMALLGLGGVLLQGRNQRRDKFILRMLLIVSLLNAGVMAYTANLGGKIMHTELRNTPAESGLGKSE